MTMDEIERLMRLEACIARNESAQILAKMCLVYARTLENEGMPAGAQAIRAIALRAGRAIMDRDPAWLPKSS